MLDIPTEYANDPRIAYVGGHHIVIAGGARVYEVTTGGPGEVGRFDAMPVDDAVGRRHKTLNAALADLLGSPQLSKLAEVLANEFTGDQLRGMAAAIAEEGWSDVGTAFEVLRSALVEAARVS